MDEQQLKKQNLRWHFWFLAAFSAFLVVTFALYLPTRFLYQAGMQDEHHMADGHAGDGHMDAAGGHADHDVLIHEVNEVQSGLAVEMNVSPPLPQPGEPAALNFFAHFRPNRSPVSESELQIEHEKKMHVIGMRRDLTNFFHIHPVPGAEPGHFGVGHVFPAPGEYKIWSEVKHAGRNHGFGQPAIRIGSEEAASPRTDSATSRIVDRYQIAVHYDRIYPEMPATIHFSIKDAAGAEAILADYLGAQMHLAVVSEDLRSFIHAHPMEGAAHADDGHGHSRLAVPVASADVGHGAEEGGVAFSVTFPRAGNYKLFAQFAPEDWPGRSEPDAYLLGEFWVKVEPGRPPVAENLLNSWWGRLFASLALISLLSWGVKKYITVPQGWGRAKPSETANDQ